MALSDWRRNTLLAVLVFATAVSAAQEKQTISPTEPQTTLQTSPALKKGKHPNEGCVLIPTDKEVQVLSQEISKDICISAHVYDVVELADGTRFLDVCPTDVPDEQCRFTLVSPQADHNDVGDLRRYRDQNIKVRGTLRSMHGRMGIIISHMRQFSGGPEKFRPNPRLLKGFNGQSDQMPVHDPNLASAGHHRSFMNMHEQEPLPAAKKTLTFTRSCQHGP